MRYISKVTTGLSVVLLLACCGIWLLLSAPRVGYEALAIPTGSMRPSMPAGSLALVHVVPVSSLRVGDVITYVDPFNPHKTITHRIVRVYTIANKVPGFITRGDANAASDLPIPAGSVQGKVTWYAPYVGSILSWMRSWAGIAVLVYLPACLVVVEEIKRLREYFRSSLPYRLANYRRSTQSQSRLPKLVAAPLAGVVMTGVLISQPLVYALSISNNAVLTDNHISAVLATPRSSCNNDTNISIHSNSSQSAASGTVTSRDSTNGGGAVSGNVRNTNATDTRTSISSSC